MTRSHRDDNAATGCCGLPARLFMIGFEEIAGTEAAMLLINELDEAGVSVDDYLERLIVAWKPNVVGGGKS